MSFAGAPVNSIVVAKLAKLVTTPTLEIIGIGDGTGETTSECNLFGRDVITEVDGGEIIAHFTRSVATRAPQFTQSKLAPGILPPALDGVVV